MVFEFLLDTQIKHILKTIINILKYYSKHSKCSANEK